MARKINHDSVNILMYSKDRNLISKNGDSESIERHRQYARTLHELNPGSEMRIVALSRLKEKDRIESDCCNLIVSSSKTRFRSCFALDLIRATIRLTRDWRPDVIVSQEPLDDGIVALVMSKVLKTRFITQLHYDFLDKYWVEKSMYSKLRTLVSIYVLKCAIT